MFPSQGTSISGLVEKATSDLLLGPDWGMNMDLCDHINRDPEGGKDVVKAVRKRLHSKNPKVQLLALTVLESCIKNCGEGFHANVAHSKELLPEMVKIVTKKSDYAVRDKILQLLDIWQETFGGPRGRYPQFYDAYDQVRRKGIMFPNRDVEHMAPVFTPPATQASGHYGGPSHDASRSSGYAQNGAMPAIGTGVGPLTPDEMKSAKEASEILNEMLANVDPNNRASVQDELIVDLSEQVRAAQRRIEQFAGSTDDEKALAAALSFNDELAKVLAKHDAIATGQPLPEDEPPRRASEPQQARSYADEEDEDDFARLAHRSSRRSSNPDAPRASSSRPTTIAPPRTISRPPGDREKTYDLLSGEYVDAVGSPTGAQGATTGVQGGSPAAEQPVTEAPQAGRLAPPPGRYTETTNSGLPTAPASVRTRPAQPLQQQLPPAAFGQSGSPAYAESPQQTQAPFGGSPQTYQSPSYQQTGQSPPYQQVSPPWAQPSMEPTFKASQPYSPPTYETAGYNANQYGQQYNPQYKQAPVSYPAQLALPYGGSPVSPLSGGQGFQANDSPFDPPSEEKPFERRSSLGNSYGQSSDFVAPTQKVSLGNGPRTMTGQPLPQKKEPERRADDIDALFADLVNLKKPQFGGKS